VRRWPVRDPTGGMTSTPRRRSGSCGWCPLGHPVADFGWCRHRRRSGLPRGSVPDVPRPGEPDNASGRARVRGRDVVVRPGRSRTPAAGELRGRRGRLRCGQISHRHDSDRGRELWGSAQRRGEGWFSDRHSVSMLGVDRSTADARRSAARAPPSRSGGEPDGTFPSRSSSGSAGGVTGSWATRVRWRPRCLAADSRGPRRPVLVEESPPRRCRSGPLPFDVLVRGRYRAGRSPRRTS
jgi:hypothetical protein